MWKPVLAGTIAVLIAGSSLVYAQQRPGQPEPGRRWQHNVEDIRAFGEARLAALKAGLTLTAEQEKFWPAFEQAARELQKVRFDRASAAMAARRDGQPRTVDPAERMSQRAAVMTETGAALKKLADATDPLYKSLDDGQKRRFAILSRMMGPRDGRGHHFRGRDGGPRMWHRDHRRTDAPDGMMPRHRMMPGHFERTIGGGEGGERL